MSKKLKTLKSIDVRSRFDFIDSFGTLFKNVIRKSNHDTLKDMVKQLVDFAIRINKEETEKGAKLSYNNDKIIILFDWVMKSVLGRELSNYEFSYFFIDNFLNYLRDKDNKLGTKYIQEYFPKIVRQIEVSDDYMRRVVFKDIIACAKAEELLMEDDSLGSTCIEFILKNRLCGKKVFFSRVEVYTEQIADIERSRTIADKEKIKESSKTRED